MSPVLAENSVLLTLPFGGAVLQKIGVTRQEIDAILEDFRKLYMEDCVVNPLDNDSSFGFLDMFRRKLPPSNRFDNDDDNVRSSDGNEVDSDGSVDDKRSNTMDDLGYMNHDALVLKDDTQLHDENYVNMKESVDTYSTLSGVSNRLNHHSNSHAVVVGSSSLVEQDSRASNGDNLAKVSHSLSDATATIIVHPEMLEAPLLDEELKLQ